MTTTFDDVIEGWQVAPATAIHPLKHVSEDDYWASGVAQAEDAAIWIPDGGTVMDFGCGEGRLALPLSLFGYKVIAVDASVEMLERLRTNEKERGGRVAAVIQSNGLNFPEILSQSLESVDAIVARAVLIHHSHEDVERLVRKLVTVLKPGGYLIADWPLATVHPPYVRQNWTDVTTWDPDHRLQVGTDAGLELVDDGSPTVWMKV